MTADTRLRASLVVIAALAVPASAQAPTPAETRTRVETLASDAFDGRLAGLAGRDQGRATTSSKELTRIGAKPLPGLTSLLVPFTSRPGRKTAARGSSSRRPAARRRRSRRPTTSWRSPSPTTARQRPRRYSPATASSCPSSQRFGYDSYATLDVKDKVVVVLRYFPEDADADARACSPATPTCATRRMAARQHGAKAMLVVTGPRSPNAGRDRADDVRHRDCRIRDRRGEHDAARWRTRCSRPRRASRSRRCSATLDSGNPHVAGFPIPGVTVSIDAKVVREKRTGHNVVAYLPATAPVASVARSRGWRSARTTITSATARAATRWRGKDERARFIIGADDNASGIGRRPRHRRER